MQDSGNNNNNNSDNNSDNNDATNCPESIPGSQMPGHPMTAVYCQMHDQGALILGHHGNAWETPPDWLATTICNGPCDWWWHGHIQTDGTNSLFSQATYDAHYGSGWKVSFYGIIEVYDIHGNLVYEPFRYIREPATEVCIAMQDLELPALVTLAIIDQLFPNTVRMWAKWEMITAVKHFHQRQQYTK